MVRAVWLNTSPRRRPRAVRPEGGVEGWCPAIPRGPLGCILLTTILRSVSDLSIRSRPVPGLDLLLMALFVSFGGRFSIKTLSSSSYSDASRLSSLGSSPFELISEYHSGKLPFLDRSLFEFSSHVVWHNTTHAGIMPYHMADWKISGALGTGRSKVNRTRVIDHRWYGSIPHGTSELLIGPLHRNRHVTCGNHSSHCWHCVNLHRDRDVVLYDVLYV